jgi:transposase InsO family protein
VEVFEFIEANRREFKVSAMCRLYGVSRAGFYAWRSRAPSERARQNERLADRIKAVHRASGGTYGSPRVYRELRRRGCRASENRIARLMRAHGVKARVATIRYTNPTLQRFFGGARNEQLELDLSGPDQVWVGDLTYLKVGTVYRYLAVVMDKYSRRVLGWAYGRRKDVALTLRALNRAVRARRPPRGLIFHTDRGIEYAAEAFKARLAELGITQSMNRPGKVTDNAYIESFFHSMKADIVHGLRFTEDWEIERAVRTYVPFYNGTRLHSSLNYVPPATFERLT